MITFMIHRPQPAHYTRKHSRPAQFRIGAFVKKQTDGVTDGAEAKGDTDQKTHTHGSVRQVLMLK